jgi:ubiquinol oxidase
MLRIELSIVVLFLDRIGTSLAFAPRPSLHLHSHHQDNNDRRLLRSTTLDDEISAAQSSRNASSNNNNNNSTFLTTFGHTNHPRESFEVDYAAARGALQRLHDRQRNELLETERMLQALSITAANSDSESGDDLQKYKASLASSSRQFSTAASILSGTDYGFVSRSEGPPAILSGGLSALNGNTNSGINYGPPSNIWTLGTQQFIRNLLAMKGEYADDDREDRVLTPRQVELQAKLQQLKLNSTAIWELEYKDGPIVAPWIIKIPYLAVCQMLDVLFERSYVPARFFLLETVARMPYFSYISMLHLYETLGFWRRSADTKRIHFAEEINEYAHLMIMEALGGDQSWWVRFVAQHSAIVYYFVLCALFALSPTLSYRFSELLETHAVNTYTVFLNDNEQLLKELPPVNAAVNYYSLGTSDPFYAEFQIASVLAGSEVRTK